MLVSFFVKKEIKKKKRTNLLTDAMTDFKETDEFTCLEIGTEMCINMEKESRIHKRNGQYY